MASRLDWIAKRAENVPPNGDSLSLSGHIRIQSILPRKVTSAVQELSYRPLRPPFR